MLDNLADTIRPAFLTHFAEHPFYPCRLFLSATDMQQRAITRHACADTPQEAWQRALAACSKALEAAEITPVILRADWVTQAQTCTWQEWLQQLDTVRLGYVRTGIALDAAYTLAFTEQELNANGLLFQDEQDKPEDAASARASFNRARANAYCLSRFGTAWPDLPPYHRIEQFSTQGVFVQQGDSPRCIGAAGHRGITQLDVAALDSMIPSLSSYLTHLCNENGKFRYVRMPCHDVPLGDYYNTLRHLGTVYAMLEAYELLGGDALRAAIERATAFVVQHFAVRKVLPDGTHVAFFKETYRNEVRLGGNGIGLLLFTKYAALLDAARYADLIDALGHGILYMQEDDGGFVHILHSDDLSLVKRFCIVFYDGEAVFGLLRLYALTGKQIWLDAVLRAFDKFIATKHWQHHDHWLSYATDELTRINQNDAYFTFGLNNTTEILGKITSGELPAPTRLEQIMAAQRMIARLEATHPLLRTLDRAKFAKARDSRALKQADSFFWPEVAMFFAHPAAVVGSVFMRYNAFRIRIDDIQHTLSGLLAYRRWLTQSQASGVQQASQVFYAHNSNAWRNRLAQMHMLQPPQVRTEEHAFILPLLRRNDVKSNQGAYKGGVCTADFHFLTGLRRDRFDKILNYTCIRGYTPETWDTRDATVIFGGVLFEHFGHLILDGFARLWYFAEHPDTEYKFIFIAIPGQRFKYTEFFDLAGLTPDRYEILERPTQFTRVIIPDQAFINYNSGHPQWLRFFERIKSRIALPHTPTYDKLYLTKTQFVRNDGVNEEYYESFYARQGYKVIAPETFSLAEQIHYISHAKKIVCTLGTLAHMCVFAPEGAEIVLLLRYADFIMPSQLCINRLKKFSCTFIEATKNLLPTKQSNGTFYYFPTEYFTAYCRDAGLQCTPPQHVDLESLYTYLQRWTQNFIKPQNFKYIAEFTSFDFLNTAHQFFFEKNLLKAAYSKYLLPAAASVPLSGKQEKQLWRNIGVSCAQLATFAFHFSHRGWIFNVSNAAIVQQQKEQLEALHIGASAYSIAYAAYQPGHGWQTAESGGEPCGVTGKSLPVIAVWFKPVRAPAQFSVAYRVFIEGSGWTELCRDGEICGKADETSSVHITGIQVIVEQYKE